jgi:ADP-heptose:LPS heptosyltransferase
MERFDDQPLRPRPHLAVLFQDKLGGFVVATPLLRGLKEKYPGATLDYFGGERTVELEAACPFIDARFSLYGVAGALRNLPRFLAERESAAGPYDLAINLDFNPLNAVAAAMLGATYVVGRVYQPDGRKEVPLGHSKLDELQQPSTFWAGESFLARYGEVVESNFIGEIFCRLAHVVTDYHRLEVPTASPPLDVPSILIATGGSRPAKLWPGHYWKELVSRCCDAGATVGLLGAAPRIQLVAYGSADVETELLASTPLIDLRGRLTLPEVAGALGVSRACVTIDNGIMHLACAVGTPTVALFGASPWGLWAPHVPTLHLALPTEPCTLCRDNRFLNDSCLRERQVCLESVVPDAVLAQLQSLGVV